MINLETETVITAREACKRLPRRRAGRQTHPTTIARWMDEGIRGVRLEGLRIGANRCTSIEALQRFCERLTATDAPSSNDSEEQRGEAARAS